MKKTYTCKKCGQIYTSDLGVCPQCLTPRKKGVGLITKLILIILTVLIIALTIGLVTEISDDSSQTSSGVSSEDSQVLNIGDTLSADGLNITLEKAEVWNSDNQFIKPKDGYEFIRAYFALENTNSSSRYLGSYDFSCYADDTKADMSFFGEDILALGDDISGGRSLKGYIYYEVPVKSKNIEIEYGSDWWGDSKVTFIVK